MIELAVQTWFALTLVAAALLTLVVGAQATLRTARRAAVKARTATGGRVVPAPARHHAVSAAGR